MNLVLALVAGLAVTQLAIFSTTVYLHRGGAHRALNVTPGTSWVFRFVLWLTTGIRTRQWVAVHRKHHANTDEPADPHSPLQVGFWRVQLLNAVLYRRVASDELTVRRYAKDLPPDRWDRALFDRPFLGLAIGITFLCLTLGWQTGLVAAGFHAAAYVLLGGAINAVGHTFGRRPYPNSATNGQLLALATGGEGLHNNHHAAPTSARFALARREIDPGWWMVRALVRLRLAEVRHDEVKLRSAA
jgi:stearoyl-CoA desaturase (delta-9 desaturase)